MDWIRFLEDNHVSYVTRGPNTKRGEVSIQCPYCGDDDPSEHLGISLGSELWGCHRNGAHRGKAAHRLIQALLGCSYPQAKLLAHQYSRPDPETLDDAIATLQELSGEVEPTQWEPPDPLDDFKHFRRITKKRAVRHWKYLRERGYGHPEDLVSMYELKFTNFGRWKQRIIIPLYQNDELVGWTARALTNPISAPRYLTSSDAVKRTVFNEDSVMRETKSHSTLVVCEGPFDAIKLDYFGRIWHARATCTFGTSLSMDQVYVLNRLTKRYRTVIVLFDVDAIDSAFKAQDWLQRDNVILGHLPEGVKDPGEMTTRHITRFFEDERHH